MSRIPSHSRAVAARRTGVTPAVALALLALGLMAFVGVSGAHSETLAQNTQAVSPESRTGPGGAMPPDSGSALSAAPKGGVIEPPPMLDTGMTKPTPNPEAFPTPIVKPPAVPGDNTTPAPK